MDIEVINKADETGIKFKDLEPGTVFEFGEKHIEGNVKALKLENNKYVLLTFSNGADWFAVGDNSMLHRDITKIYGKLVGLKVQL